MANRRADRIGQNRTQLEKNKQTILKTQTVCGICGLPVDMNLKYPDPLSPTIDHIIPLAKGGHPSDLSNLQLAHRCCNREKGAKLMKVQIKEENTGEDIGSRNLPLHFDWQNYAVTR